MGRLRGGRWRVRTSCATRRRAQARAASRCRGPRVGRPPSPSSWPGSRRAMACLQQTYSQQVGFGFGLALGSGLGFGFRFAPVSYGRAGEFGNGALSPPRLVFHPDTGLYRSLWAFRGPSSPIHKYKITRVNGARGQERIVINPIVLMCACVWVCVCALMHEGSLKNSVNFP